MMFGFKCVILCYAINSVFLTEAKIKYMCETKVTDMKNNPIENVEEYCSKLDKPCLPKCCGEGETLNYGTSTCVKRKNKKRKLAIYKTIEDNTTRTMKKLSDFNLIRNRMFENEICIQKKDFYFKKNYGIYRISEKGVFASKEDFKCRKETLWVQREPEYFCVDVAYQERSQNKTTEYFFFLVAKEYGSKKQEQENLFVGVSFIISLICMGAVLVVYSVLAELRNLPGMLLMAYVATLSLTFLIQTIRIFALKYMMSCAELLGVYYFAYMSTFFWLNIFSFDIWWTFRGLRLKRAINRQGILVKFGWYSLYGWGAPLALTVIAVVLDTKLPKNVIRPCFDSCLNDATSNRYYMRIPTGIITTVNIVLFLMTVYNIWLSKRIFNKFKSDSSSSKNNENSFILCLKMSLTMGTSWMLELVEDLYTNDLPFWAFVLMHLYNALIGVIIFVMFILTRKTMNKLCKRFNFKFPCAALQDFIEEKKKLNPNGSRSTTKSTTNGSYHKKSTDNTSVDMSSVEVNENPDPN